MMKSLPYLIPLTYFMYPAASSDSCQRMTLVHDVKANFSECNLKTFIVPVPAYFCIGLCDSLPDCTAVTMEMRNVTSWCCAFSAPISLEVECGNHILIHSKQIELNWGGECNKFIYNKTTCVGTAFYCFFLFCFIYVRYITFLMAEGNYENGGRDHKISSSILGGGVSKLHT